LVSAYSWYAALNLAAACNNIHARRFVSLEDGLFLFIESARIESWIKIHVQFVDSLRSPELESSRDGI
jgi:hypothetical protein